MVRVTVMLGQVTSHSAKLDINRLRHEAGGELLCMHAACTVLRRLTVSHAISA